MRKQISPAEAGRALYARKLKKHGKAGLAKLLRLAGLARAESLTAERRLEISRLGLAARAANRAQKA